MDTRGIPATVPQLRPIAGRGGQPKLALRAPDGAIAEVYLHGAHVTSWVPAGPDAERLFVSATSAFRSGAPIRGGVPVIFPQFGAFGSLPRHGFARTSDWQPIAATGSAGDTASVTLRLIDSAASRALWPHAFSADMTVTVRGAALTLQLAVSNTGRAPMEFTAALHTYLRVGDVRQTLVRGLEGCTFRDSTQGGAEYIQTEPELAITGEIDRIYLQVSRKLALIEPGRTTGIESSGFPDAVVWNPGAERGAALPDLEPGGHARMLCIEAAAVAAPILLDAGQRWSGVQRLSAR